MPVTLPPPPSTDDEEDDQQKGGELHDSQSTHDEWDDYVIPRPESPVPGPADSPPEDIGGFHNILERDAQRFQIPMPSQQQDCFLYDFKEPFKKSVRSIPVIDYIWDQGIKIMHNPSSVRPVLPRLDKKYGAPDTAPACLTGHPKPDSVITQAAQRKSKNPSAPLSAPPDKEGRLLDNIGKCLSSMSALTVRASNSLALLGCYNRQMWADIAPYLAALPDDSKEEAKKILLEGERSASEIDCAMDIASTGFRQLAGAAVLRRQGWLKATSFRPEVQTKILDMPYDGQLLFGTHIDEALQGIKKDTETARALGTLQFKNPPFRGSRGRGQFSSRGGYQQYRSSYSSSTQQYRLQYQQCPQQSSSFSKTSFRGKGGRQKGATRRQ